MKYEQLTMNGYFDDPNNAGDLPSAPSIPVPTTEDRPLDKVKEPTPRKRSREREER